VTREHERQNRAFWDADADAYQAYTHRTSTGRRRGGVAHRGVGLGVLGLDASPGSTCSSSAAARPSGRARSPLVARASGGSTCRSRSSATRGTHGRGAAFVPLVCASGEATPFADASFDVVFCDHGALSFCDTGGRRRRVRAPAPGLVGSVFCLTTPLVYSRTTPRATTRPVAGQPWEAEWKFDAVEGTTDFVWSAGA
jgi:hypothetical protein